MSQVGRVTAHEQINENADALWADCTRLVEKALWPTE